MKEIIFILFQGNVHGRVNEEDEVSRKGYIVLKK
jgi:hypothetical protein